MQYIDSSIPPPIMKQDEVKGIVASTSPNANRYFYLLDPVSDLVWEVDGYEQPVPDGATPQWMLLIMCPNCRNGLRLESSKKQFDINAEGIETAEPFRCAWPIDKDGYKGNCPWGAELQRPNREIRVPVRTPNGMGREVRIDALIRAVK